MISLKANKQWYYRIAKDENEFVQDLLVFGRAAIEVEHKKMEGMKDYEAFDNMHRADGSFSKSERFSKL